MPQLVKYLKNNYLFVLILTLGFAVRVWGIGYDLPLVSTVGDELPAVSAAAGLLARHSLIPEATFSVQFPLIHYVYALAFLPYLFWLFLTSGFSLVAVKAAVALDLSGLLLCARIASLLMGVASVYLVYIIGRKVFKTRTAAYMAALFFAVDPLNVSLSHFARVWGPQEFFILLSFYFSLRFWSNPDRKLTLKGYLPPVFFIVLAFALNLPGILAYFLWLIAALVYGFNCRLKNFFRYLFSRQSLLFHGLFFAGLAIVLLLAWNSLDFYVIIFNEFFSKDPNYIQSGKIYVRTALPLWQRVGLSLNAFFQYETMAFIALLPAFYLLYKKNKQVFWLLFLSFSVFYLSLNPPLVSSARTRFLAIMMPFLILPAAWLFGEIFKKLKKINIFLAALLLIIITIPSLFINLKDDYLLAQSSTNLELYYWLKKNLKTDERAFITGSYLYQELLPSQEIFTDIKEYSPEYYSARFKILNQLQPDVWQSGYNLYSDGFFCSWPQALVGRVKFQYVIIAENSDLQIDPANFKICGGQKIDLTKAENVFHRETAPYFKYSILESYVIGDNLYAESYIPLLKINQYGPRINVYKLAP